MIVVKRWGLRGNHYSQHILRATGYDRGQTGTTGYYKIRTDKTGGRTGTTGYYRIQTDKTGGQTGTTRYYRIQMDTNGYDQALGAQDEDRSAMTVFQFMT